MSWKRVPLWIGGVPFCLTCGRQMRWNWKKFSRGIETDAFYRIAWHHVRGWGTWNGC